MVNIPWPIIGLFFLVITVVCASSNNETSTYRSVAYYTNWSIYARNFFPQDILVESLTHVIYAFANISVFNNTVYLSDLWADTSVKFPGDLVDEPGHNIYGCIKQLYLLKKSNRNLKVLLSIGGSTYSSNFAEAVSDSDKRATFASSAISLLTNLGFDGLDINWEFPADAVEAENLLFLMKTIRDGLDAYECSLETPYHFELTVGSPAGISNAGIMRITDMDPYIDFWNLMAYDYAGPWSPAASNQANLFPSEDDQASTPFNTKDAVNYYLGQGVSASKIVLGIPVYGRSFENTDGLGHPYTGIGGGTWEAGIYDYKSLPLAGAGEVYDNLTGSSYTYDEATRELISYDTVAVVKQKAKWIQQMGLGGAMWWESSADAVGNNSLIRSVATCFANTIGSSLQNSSNELEYLNSTYDNIRSGMPDSISVPISTHSIVSSASSMMDPQASSSLNSLEDKTSLESLAGTTSNSLVNSINATEAVYTVYTTLWIDPPPVTVTTVIIVPGR